MSIVVAAAEQLTEKIVEKVGVDIADQAIKNFNGFNNRKKGQILIAAGLLGVVALTIGIYMVNTNKDLPGFQFKIFATS